MSNKRTFTNLDAEKYLSVNKPVNEHIKENKIDYPINQKYFAPMDNNMNIKGSADVKTDINSQCLTLANQALTKIKWKNYQDVQDKKYYTPIAIMITVVTALLVSSAFEFYRIALFHYSLNIPFLSYRITYIIFTSVFRAVYFFILAREIINFRILFTYEVGITSDMLSFLILDNKSQIKLLIFSLAIGGIPVISFFTGFHFISNEISLLTTDPSSGYSLFIIEILIDIAMLIFLVFAVPKFVIRKKMIKI